MGSCVLQFLILQCIYCCMVFSWLTCPWLSTSPWSTREALFTSCSTLATYGYNLYCVTPFCDNQIPHGSDYRWNLPNEDLHIQEPLYSGHVFQYLCNKETSVLRTNPVVPSVRASLDVLTEWEPVAAIPRSENAVTLKFSQCLEYCCKLVKRVSAIQ